MTVDEWKRIRGKLPTYQLTEYELSALQIDNLSGINKPVEDLAETLEAGNTTGGNDLIVSAGDKLKINDTTASRIAGTGSSKEIVSLDTTTYPDLTELSYVKGATSNIQTQIDDKEPEITILPISKGGTNSGTALNNNRLMISSGDAIVESTALTASRVLVSNGSGIPIGADTSVYPSLTEFSYNKGVTSAIQTQIDAKSPTASPTFTGTPAAPTASQGNNSTQLATTAYVDTGLALKLNKSSVPCEFIIFLAIDPATAITTGTTKAYFRAPYAFTLTGVRAALGTTQTSGSIYTLDINESGTTILSTKLTIDNGETTSVTAATPPVISDSAIADDALLTIDVDQVGDGTAKWGSVVLIGTHSV